MCSRTTSGTERQVLYLWVVIAISWRSCGGGGGAARRELRAGMCDVRGVRRRTTWSRPAQRRRSRGGASRAWLCVGGAEVVAVDASTTVSPRRAALPARRAALAMESIKSKVPSPLARALSDVAEADGKLAEAAESRKLAAEAETRAKWTEIMTHWVKGDFAETAGFTRDLTAEKFFADGCALDLTNTRLKQRFSGPAGASDWLADKADFDFGTAPHRGDCWRDHGHAPPEAAERRLLHVDNPRRDGARLRRQAARAIGPRSRPAPPAPPPTRSRRSRRPSPTRSPRRTGRRRWSSAATA